MMTGVPITEDSGPRNKRKEDSDWKPFASFVVEFQTRTIGGQPQARRTKVHHLEADTYAVWLGMGPVQLCQWMVEQLDGVTE